MWDVLEETNRTKNKHRFIMRCKTCQRVIKSISIKWKSRHSWNHNQCVKCHFLNLSTGRSLQKSENSRLKGPRFKIQKYRAKITNENIELYCKLSQILRNKPCKRNQVLARQNYSTFVRITLP